MIVHRNFSLKEYNTFHVEVYAKYFAAFDSVGLLERIRDERNADPLGQLILGGGSNILFTRDFEGWILKNEIKGIQVVHEDERHAYVKAGAGENWHGLVVYCVSKNLGGIENLSLIPGNVGASPIQNIGAYGVELKDALHSVEAYSLEDHKIITFSNNDCEFGYRDSVFKNRLRNQYVILHITLRLDKEPRLQISYGAIKEELEKMGVVSPELKDVSEAIIRIRSSKLPNPFVLGNAGSFFKNPVIDKASFEAISNKEVNEKIPFYLTEDGKYKIPAGWLIEKCGWKGYRNNDAGCYEKQALVLVNYGAATGAEILALSESIQQSVRDRFGISLEVEVNLV